MGAVGQQAGLADALRSPWCPSRPRGAPGGGVRPGHSREEVQRAPPWAGTAAAGRARAPAVAGRPHSGVGAAGRTCPVGPAWAAASASARPGTSLFLRVAAPLLPCCRLGAVFGVGSETPVGCGEVAPQSDTAPGSRGGAGPSGKAAWLSPALGPSVVVSGHGARTGGRLTHRPRSWVSKQVARRAPQTQQVRRAGRVTAGRLSGGVMRGGGCGRRGRWAGRAGGCCLEVPGFPALPRRTPQGAVPGTFPWSGALGWGAGPSPQAHRAQGAVQSLPPAHGLEAGNPPSEVLPGPLGPLASGVAALRRCGTSRGRPSL